MTSVVSLFANPGSAAAAAEVIDEVGDRLHLEPQPAVDGSWEFIFHSSYAHAHATVVEALAATDPQWPAKVTLDYVLVV
jgi:hypothetical protein